MEELLIPSTVGDTGSRDVSPKFHGKLEITMNYPRTIAFSKKTSVEQKKIYSILWHKLKCLFGHNDNDFVYEYCKSGHVHLHGWIDIKGKYFIAGLVADYVKSYLRFMPTKFSRYKDFNYYPEYTCYKSPSILVRYRDMEVIEDRVRHEEYLKYMLKQQDNIN